MFKHRVLFVAAGLVLYVLATAEAIAQATAKSGLLVSRSELGVAATQAEIAATSGNPATRTQNAILASALRQRLRDGDFQVGDRILVTITSDAVHRDTLVVRSGPTLEISGPILVPLAGVLRSEVKDRISTEVLKYVKAREVEATPLMRVGILGAVARPGFFAFPSDMTLSDAIMGAGGPTGTADFGRALVRRGAKEYRSAADTRQAIANGLTFDQFGLTAGDEIQVGTRREFSPGTITAVAGAITSVTALFFLFRR